MCAERVGTPFSTPCTLCAHRATAMGWWGAVVTEVRRRCAAGGRDRSPVIGSSAVATMPKARMRATSGAVCRRARRPRHRRRRTSWRDGPPAGQRPRRPAKPPRSRSKASCSRSKGTVLMELTVGMRERSGKAIVLDRVDQLANRPALSSTRWPSSPSHGCSTPSPASSSATSLALDAVATEGTFGRAASDARLHAVGRQPADRRPRAGDRRRRLRPSRRPEPGAHHAARQARAGPRPRTADKAQTTAEAIERFKAGEGRIDIGTFQSVSTVLLPQIVHAAPRRAPGRRHPRRRGGDGGRSPARRRARPGLLGQRRIDGDDRVGQVARRSLRPARSPRRLSRPDPVRSTSSTACRWCRSPVVCDRGRVDAAFAAAGVEPLVVFRTADNGAVDVDGPRRDGPGGDADARGRHRPDDDALVHPSSCCRRSRPRQISVIWQSRPNPLAARPARRRHLRRRRRRRGRAPFGRPQAPFPRRLTTPTDRGRRPLNVKVHNRYSCLRQQTPAAGSERRGRGGIGCEMARHDRYRRRARSGVVAQAPKSCAATTSASSSTTSTCWFGQPVAARAA